MSRLHSYSSIYALGHKALAQLLSSPVVVQEKIDGSQFSWGVDAETGELLCRSKGAEINLDAPEKMFTQAVSAIRDIQSLLMPGAVYRAEYLSKPKHNVLSYSRMPQSGLVLFDVDEGDQVYQSPAAVARIAEMLGLEPVFTFFGGRVDSFEQLKDFLTQESSLGGVTVEGIVVKNYSLFGPDKKVLMGKYVNEAFKEKHQKEWKTGNPGKKEIIEQLIDEFCTEARWRKAIQHLRDAGQLTDSPQDIGKLLLELATDLEKEELDYISKRFLAYALPKIQRGVRVGFPEFYKLELAKLQFEAPVS
jgi:hypothetical protein